jgi:hypothetical protein
MRTGFVFALLALFLVACPPGGVKVDDTQAPSTDLDGDGYTEADGDCDDGDAEVHPGAVDMVGDDVDSDCDGIDGQDADADGYASVQSGGDDCDDDNPYVHPDATEGWYDGVDQDCDGGSDYDQDGDGFDAEVAGGADCDDTDPRVSPDADEYCNGVDDDCDAFVDEDDAVDRETFYGDLDGDGYGVDGVSTQACELPSGYAPEAGDCDDGDPLINPGADEICNGIDDDCDDSIDEDAVDATLWYEDGDGDGYGDPATVIASCDTVLGLVSEGGDCDDSAPAIHPGADEYCDGVDSDCDGELDEDEALDVLTWYQDADADGYGDAAVSELDCDPVPGHVDDASDCDDGDAAIYPGAYDLPDDGIDGDCDGVDREFDGVVLVFGDRTTSDEELGSGGDGYDVVVLFDTTGSMGSALYSLDMAAIDAAITTSLGNVQYGFATFDDYAYGSYGSSSSGDLPFILQQQVTDDLSAVEDAVAAADLHYGSDQPESAMEALYQALTGAGYDQDCDTSYDSSTDVLPFLADGSDPFGGVGGESYDAKSSGGGLVGGMGFRDSAIPIVAYVTDQVLRDPDDGYGTPGGCHMDAGGSDVIAAALELGAWLVGLQYDYDTSTPYAQMQDLALATDSLADLDGDGVPEELAWADVSDVNTTIATAIEAIDLEVELALTFDEVWLEAADDPHGMVSGIMPGSYTSVSAPDWPLLFTIGWAGTLPATSSPQSVTVGFELYGDGDVIDSFEIEVEVPPT